ncbi:hypothetical protein L1281_002151 [Neisseria sp. HSC-16F19]|nr:hypothetical protein [Neisseria sp. HSC-16F19]MCP2041544.1 hypothetical protein [Neisseria sp. HSC-16F19]
MKPKSKLPENPKYAPMHSLPRTLITVAVLIALFLLIDRGLFPWMRHTSFLACDPHGPAWLLYGLYSGLPLLFGLSALALFGRIAVLAIRHRQYPPPGQTVLLPRIRYRYGLSAQLTGYGLLAIVALLLVMSAAGAVYVHHTYGDKLASTAAERLNQPCTDD